MEATPRAPVLDDLLTHAAWVRALARTLVADAGVAEDVVQETWVAALERPPTRDENLRGWLATVVRNAVRMRGRGAGRRAGHETRVARERDNALPSSADLAERLDTQRRLAERVLALDEPYRSTVILRYYEGLSAAEIARRTDVPAGTVRWRLKTALAELRELLDEDFGGQRAAWIALVLPLAERDGALAGSALGGVGLMQGILTMNLGLKLGLSAALVTATLFLTPFGAQVLELFRGSEPLNETPVEVSFRPIETANQEPEEATPEPARTEVLSTPPVTDSSETSAQLAGFRLRAVEADGTPIVGVEASFWGQGQPSTSNGDGEVLVLFGEDMPFGQWLDTISLRHGEFAKRTVSGQPDAARLVELGDVVMEPAGSIDGRVLATDGSPAVGAWVIVANEAPSTEADYREARVQQTASRGRTPITDADGRFRLDGVAVGNVRLWAGLEGELASLVGPIEVRRGTLSSGVEIVLGRPDPKDFITGEVRLPDGSPADYADLRYEYSGLMRSGSGSFTVRQDGSFQLACVPAGERTLIARDQNGEYAPTRIEEVQGGDHVILQLVENDYMRLDLQGDGSAIQEPEIWGYGADHEDTLVLPNGVLESEGNFLVPIPQETFRLEIHVQGYELAKLGPFDGATAPRSLTVELGSLPGLQGTVTSDGRPIEGARVELYAVASQRTIHNDFFVRVQPRSKASAKSSSEGDFDLTFREANEYYVRVSAEGFAPTELGPLYLDPERGYSGLAVELGTGGSIEGRVRVADGFPAGRIVAISRGDGHAQTTRCQADGTYRFDQLTPGPWQVQLNDAEIVPGSSSTTTDSSRFRESEIQTNCRVRAGEVTHFNLDEGAPSAVELEGTLIIDGAGAKGWTASLFPVAELERLRADPPSTSLDDDGHFALRIEEPGEYRLTISEPGSGLRILLVPLILPAGLSTWSADFDTGTVHLEGVEPPSPSHLDILVTEHNDYTFLWALLPDTEETLTLDGVPEGQGSIRRYNPEEAATQDPATSGTKLVEVPVHAGGEVTVQIP